MQLTPIMDPQALNRFLEADFPQLHTDGKVFEVMEVGPGTVVHPPALFAELDELDAGPLSGRGMPRTAG